MQTWTSRDGLQFRGRVTGYGSKVVVVSYVAGAVRVNNKPIHEIDEIYQKMIPKIVAESLTMNRSLTKHLCVCGLADYEVKRSPSPWTVS